MGIKLGLKIVSKKPEKLNELTKKLQANIDESVDLIQDYFELEQYKNTKFLKHSSFYLDSLLNEIIQELEPEMSVKNIKLLTSIPQNLIIKTNKEWLKKALFNLIHNAIKYNKKDGLLFIKVEYKNNGYLILIKDTGVGIKEEDKQKIFNKFYTKDANYGTGIGATFSKVVIENLGGKIYFDSKEQKGTEFYIYLPKTSKKIKIQRIAAALAVIFIVSLFTIDYFYCLIPQKVKIQTSGNIKIIHFENGIIAKANKNDKFKIIAYKNIFNTRTRNKIILKKADMEIVSKGNKINIITPNLSFKNLGTDFETVSNKNTAVSVFDGKIESKNIIVDKEEGLIAAKTIQKLPLPVHIDSLKVKNNPDLIISWDSPYNKFKILVSKDKNFEKLPIYQFITQKKHINLTVPDGEWYISIKAEDKNLYSPPVIKKILSLNNYYKALQFYKQNDIQASLIYIKKSISTINNKNFKPYFLYAKILLTLKKYNEAFEYLEKGERLGGKDNLLKAKILFIKHQYNKVIAILKPPKNIEEKLLIAKSYYKLKKFNLANKYLYQILEQNPNNKEALQMLSLSPELKKTLLWN